MTESHISSSSTSLRESFARREPLIRIRPGRRSFLSDLHEIWTRRELFFVMVWRDLKVRYKQTILGVSWAILQPLLMTLVFAIFFGVMVRVPSDGVPYSVFAYSGLLLWVFFSQTLGAGSLSLSGNAHLINKIYFPPLILPLVNVCVRLIDLAAASLVLLGLMLYHGIYFGLSMLWAPVLVLQLGLLAFALSAWLAALQLKYRDVGSLLPIVLQVWMFASPIVYPMSLVPDKWRNFYSLNPVVGILENLRAALFGSPFDSRLLLISAAMTVVISLVSLWGFYAMSKNLADIY